MSERSDVIFACDGSFEGVLCCAFETYQLKEIPYRIDVFEHMEESFFTVHNIETDLKKAARVKRGLIERCGYEMYALVQDCYFSACENKDLLVVEFIRIAMKCGKKISCMLSEKTVNAVYRAAHSVREEAHQYQGFVRFSISDNAMSAVIEPKGFVLPLIASHFRDRFPNEVFLIYDKTHGVAFVCGKGNYRFVNIDSFEQAPPDESEQAFRDMWKMFYTTIGIKERENYRCMIGHMQKRYWKHLTELN